MHPDSPGLSRCSKLALLATLAWVYLRGTGAGFEGINSLRCWFSAAVVLALTAILAVWILRREPRRWLHWLGIAALTLVAAQSILGRLKTGASSPGLVLFHAAIAYVIPCVLTLLSMALSRHWDVDRIVRPPAGTSHRLASVAGWTAILTTAIYFHLVGGAVIQHYRSGAPTAVFTPLPEETMPLKSLQLLVAIDIAQRFWAALAVIVSAVVIGRAIGLARTKFHSAFFEKYVSLLIWLLVFQLFLGAWVSWFLEQPTANGLFALNGVLLLMTAFALVVRSLRLRYWL